MKKPIITICSSASFYKQVVEVQQELEGLGFSALVPDSATMMKESNDFDVSHYKTWFGNANDYRKKTALIRAHFDKVAQADAILIINAEKHGKPGYIGGNVLMEMAIAFHADIPIYIYNPADPESPFTEEIIGLRSIVIDGDLTKIRPL